MVGSGNKIFQEQPGAVLKISSYTSRCTNTHGNKDQKRQVEIEREPVSDEQCQQIWVQSKRWTATMNNLPHFTQLMPMSIIGDVIQIFQIWFEIFQMWFKVFRARFFSVHSGPRCQYFSFLAISRTVLDRFQRFLYRFTRHSKTTYFANFTFINFTSEFCT